VTARLAVLGGINVDLVVSGAALPGPGETVIGGTFARHQGGKGGNQAVAAARVLGTGVAMVGAVGDDPFGEEALRALRAEGIDTSAVRTASGVATGIALIAVDPAGENQIAVAPGANAVVDAAHVRDALDALAPTVVLASLEVPADAVGEAGRWCRRSGATFVLNPAPATPEAPDLARDAAYVTPNERERTAIATPGDATIVIETRGPGGATIDAHGDIEVVPAPRVDAVDTTGAGDCFNGVFAAALAEGRPVREAVERAVRAATMSVTVAGARDGMPAATAL